MPDRVVIARYVMPHEADLARMQLESAGIRATLSGQTVTGMFWHVGSALGGIALEVPAGDAARAQAILSGQVSTTNDDTQLEAAHYRSPAAPVVDDDLAPTRDGDAQAERAYRAALLGLALCPGGLHLYSMWLLRGLPAHRLSERGRSRRRVAAVIDAVVVLGVVGLLAARVLG